MTHSQLGNELMVKGWMTTREDQFSSIQLKQGLTTLAKLKRTHGLRVQVRLVRAISSLTPSVGPAPMQPPTCSRELLMAYLALFTHHRPGCSGEGLGAGVAAVGC